MARRMCLAELFIGVPHLFFIGLAVYVGHADAVALTRALVQGGALGTPHVVAVLVSFYLAAAGVLLLGRVEREGRALADERRRYESVLDRIGGEGVSRHPYFQVFVLGVVLASLAAMTVAAESSLHVVLALNFLWGIFLLLPGIEDRLRR